MRFNHQERINFIYLATVLGQSINHIARDAQQKYTTIYTIVKEYKEHGRTNRQLNFQEKVNILNTRFERNIRLLEMLQAKGKTGNRHVPLDLTEYKRKKLVKYQWIEANPLPPTTSCSSNSLHQHTSGATSLPHD